jgi:hypothetical protein
LRERERERERERWGGRGIKKHVRLSSWDEGEIWTMMDAGVDIKERISLTMQVYFVLKVNQR